MSSPYLSLLQVQFTAMAAFFLLMQLPALWGRLDAALFGRPAPIMRNGSDVLDLADFDARGGKRAHGRLAAGTGTADPNFDRAQTAFGGTVGSRHSGLLGGEGSALAGSAEAQGPGARP